MRARGGGARAAVVVAFVVAFVVSVGLLRAGEEAPKDLVQRGRQALSKKKYDEAEDLFARAAAADPSFVGARYWIGQVREKAGDAIGAIDAYREFRDGARVLESEGRLAAEDRDLVKKATSRLASLAPGEGEYAKLRRTFAEEVLAFAQARGKDAPVGASRALEMLVGVDEENAAALEMLDILTRSGDAEAEAAWRRSLPLPLRSVRGWRDLLALQAFGEDAPPRLAYVVRGAHRLSRPAVRPDEVDEYEVRFRGDRIHLLVNDRAVGDIDRPSDRRAAPIGIAGQEAKALFRNFGIRRR